MMDLTSPGSLALINILGIGLLGILSAFGQWYGKRKETAVPPSKDIMVPSVAIADRVALEQMTDTLRDAEHVMRGHREHDTAMLYELKAINDTNKRVEAALLRMLDRMK